MIDDPTLTVTLARLSLALLAFAVFTQLLVAAWADRGTERVYAQGALAVSLLLIVGDDAYRLVVHSPFVLHVYAARAAIVVLTWVYVLARLRVHR